MPINVAKGTEQEIEAKVRSGEYESADEVVREGLELINAREELRKAIDEGAAQLDRGEGIPGEQVFDDLRKRSQELRSKAQMGSYVLAPLARQGYADGGRSLHAA
jgi:antitoxin ParD1/3/4